MIRGHKVHIICYERVWCFTHVHDDASLHLDNHSTYCSGPGRLKVYLLYRDVLRFHSWQGLGLCDQGLQVTSVREGSGVPVTPIIVLIHRHPLCEYGWQELLRSREHNSAYVRVCRV